MKVNIIDENNIVVFLFEKVTIDFDYKEKTLVDMKKIFQKLKLKHNLDIQGYYFIEVYNDEYYGIIMTISKEMSNYFSVSNQVDVEVEMKENVFFLYKIEDYFFIEESFYDKVKLYLYKNELYLKIKEKIDKLFLYKIIENSAIIYNDTDKIINLGKEIKIRI